MFARDSLRPEIGPHARRPHLGPRLAGALLALLMLVTASVTPTLAESRASTAAADDSPVLLELELPRRGKLKLVSMSDVTGKLIGYGLVEEIPDGNPSYLDIPEFAAADPAEVVNAFLPDARRMPRDLVARYGQPELGVPGWALGDDVYTGTPVLSNCYPAAFESPFGSYAYKEISYDDGPLGKSELWKLSTPSGYYTNRHSYYVTRYLAKVTHCRVDPNGYWGATPEVFLHWGDFQAKPAQQAGNMSLGLLPDYGSTVTFSWQPFCPWCGYYDVQLQVAWAGILDLFHIGYGWDPFLVS